VAARASRRWPSLRTQCSDDSAVAEALAAGRRRGLVPSYPRHRVRRVPPAAIEFIRQARQEFGYGAARTRLWLQRVHGIRLAMGTI
jgi:hypothetical protein